jgi:hypothetical protein
MESELEAFRAADQLLCEVVGATLDDTYECQGTAQHESDPAKVIPGADVVIFCGPISVYPTWRLGLTGGARQRPRASASLPAPTRERFRKGPARGVTSWK